MRYSSDKGDPGYAALQELKATGMVPDVLLNGIARQGVVTADDAEGFILIIQHGLDGPASDPDRPGHLKAIRIEGKVTFKINPIQIPKSS